MRQTPNPRPTGSVAAVRSAPVTREAAAAAPVRPPPSPGGVRVLQNRAAPAQLSLFPRALPGR